MINEILQCDFCSMPGPVWRYPARSFIAYCAPNVAGESVGDWAACDPCHLLIEPTPVIGLDQQVARVARSPIPDTFAGDVRCAVSDEAPGRVPPYRTRH